MGKIGYTYCNYKNDAKSSYPEPTNAVCFPLLLRRKRKIRVPKHRLQTNPDVTETDIQTNLKGFRLKKRLKSISKTRMRKIERYFMHAKFCENHLELEKTSAMLGISNMGMPRGQKKKLSKRPYPSVVPVYLKSSNGQVKLISLDVSTVQAAKTCISAIEHIPCSLLMVSRYGRMLTPANLSRIEPYNTLDVLCKGKGGMLESTETISNKSSSQDVTEWLKITVGIQEQDIRKFGGFQYLDGKTLLQYKTDGCLEMKNDLQIPVGIARRIMCFLKEDLKEKFRKYTDSDIYKWNVTDVIKFIRELLQTQSPDIDDICNIIDTEEIDGKALLSYSDAKEFQLELQLTNKYGVIFKRIFTKREELIETFTVKKDTKIITKPITSASNNQQNLDTSKRENTKDLKTSLLSSEWDSYIRNILKLKTLKGPEYLNPNKCVLKIIHGDWKNRNELERRFVFVLILDPKILEDPKHSKLTTFLWSKIRKNMHSWYEHLSTKDKGDIQVVTNKDDSLQIGNKCLSLSNAKPKIRFLTEKSLQELLQSDNVFLLVDKQILKGDVFYFESMVENPKKSEKTLSVLFTFNENYKYWQYNSEGFSGFRCCPVPKKYCTTMCVQEKCEGETSELKDESMQISSSNEPETVTTPLNPEEDMERAVEKNADGSSNKTEYSCIQSHRSFKGEGSEIQYKEGYRIATPEHDGSVSFRCIEYKFITDSLIKKGSACTLQFINKELLRFACGCLNSRKNGTIMFGIGDTHGNNTTNNRNFHGQIVGVPLQDLGDDFIPQCVESVRGAVSKCFEVHCHKAALKCIGNPVFIKVETRLASTPLYVIELDIEPSSVVCNDLFFKIDRSRFLHAKDIEKEATLYVRENVGTARKNKEQEMFFIRTELPDIMNRRVQDEKQMVSIQPIKQIESPMDRLRKFLCKGSNKLDKSIWPILLLNKPTDQQKDDEQWIRSLKFIKLIECHAVFDFDNDSNKNGLCRAYSNMENCILQDEQIFEEYVGKMTALGDLLGIPRDMKTVWIYSNGRADIKPQKQPTSGADWTYKYGVGICDAVTFFSHKEIIPKGRALVIILLFSNNFDGVTETFREVTKRFTWNQIIVISTDETLERFISKFPDVEQFVRERSISGNNMTWEHVNSTILEVSGFEDKSNICLTTASGAVINADEKFIESLTEFHILSAKQCENKTFKTEEEEDLFSSEIEQKFYRGEKVDWFNFYFENHVLKRHCFADLKKAMEAVLKQYVRNDRETKIVASVIIAHEPGAGGTTLAHSMLWEFHKEYRCAILKKITDRTSKNIISLWKHKEESKKARPVLLVVDELVQSELTIEDLIRQIHMDYRTNPIESNHLICCFLICQRESEISEQYLMATISTRQNDHHVQPLKQKLTETEIKWMDKKYKTLENKGAEYQPQYLLSFMILREGFNQVYIKTTIMQFLQHIDHNSNEFELLQYASFLSAYAPTSKRGPNVFIPLECCDDLMGFKTTKLMFWEKNMSNTLKMFLIVEQKETASGMQIRMAHSALAKAVLTQILDSKKEKLSTLALRFLECSIIQSSSHGREMVIDFTREMLVRRLKEEYNDERTTLFSPLIEEICKDESWKNAKDVLEKGFDKIKDNYLAQTLARLYSKNSDFENGIYWAKKSVEITTGKTANGFCHHILGDVLLDQFNFKIKQLNLSISPSKAIEYISIIIDAYKHFKIAATSRTDHISYPITRVLQTINSCLKFITSKVDINKEINIKQFLTDESYLPAELEDWNIFKPTFLEFLLEGDRACTIIEKLICFNTTFYADDKMGYISEPSREHRLYKKFQENYPTLFNDFRYFYGADDKEVPQSNMPEVINNWHRRRLIMLGGNTFMNICDILHQLRNKRLQFSIRDAKDKCLQIKTHLTQITDRTSKDLSNLITVNVVMGLLGAEKRDPNNTIVDYCKQIIKMKRDCEDKAHFFICLLLWPTNDIEVDYDEELFNESLKFLHRNKEMKYGRQRNTKPIILKEEKNVTQPTSQFFLTKLNGFRSLCHRCDLFLKGNAESQFNNDHLENFGDRYKLKRLTGFVKFFEGKSYIRMENELSRKSFPIEVRKIRSGKKEFLSEEEVSFYLGFSIAGPIAYNVKPTRHDVESVSLPSTPRMDDGTHDYLEDETNDYMDETETELLSKLKNISELKSKEKNGRKLKERDKKLVKEEKKIRNAWEIKRDDIYDNE